MRFLVLVAVLVQAGVASAKPTSGRGRVAVFPVAPVGDGVLSSAAGSMTEALLEELGDRGVIAEEQRTTSRTGANATKLIEEGRRDLQRMQIPRAVKALENAIAVSDEPKQKAQAALLLAEAHYRKGDEANGQQAMETVLRYAPETKLSPERYPPVFIKAFEDVRMHAAIAAETAPAPPPPPPTLAQTLSHNVFDSDARARALAAGKAAGAETILVLGMARGDRLFTLEAYAGQVRSGRWMALPVAQPDFDMLSASVEASKLVRELGTFKESTLDDTLVHGVAQPSPSRTVATREPVRMPVNAADAASATTDAPVMTRQTYGAEEPSQLDRDSALAADLAAIDGYDARVRDPMPEPYAHDRVERGGGISSKWYFWVGVGVGAALIGGATYYLATRDHGSGDTVSLQAAW